MDVRLSLIIPLYNRPDEIRELLESLVHQSKQDFEVIVVEDGSEEKPAEDIVKSFSQKLDVKYYRKENSGPGPARNFGTERASGNYLVFLDSDCIVPEHYIATVCAALEKSAVDAWGGPDRAHSSFSPVQKGINYAMTSMISTGGIRGGAKQMEKFHPRSFNMGIRAEAFRQLGGFSTMRFGEDIDLSMRIMEAGYSTQLIREAYVYHKRRTDLKKFFKQVHNSGIARINLSHRHPGSLKLVHFFPALFVDGTIILVLLAVFWNIIALLPLVFLALLILGDSLIREKDIRVSLISIAAVFVQLTGYGTGFMQAFWRRNVLGKDEYHAFGSSFYK